MLADPGSALRTVAKLLTVLIVAALIGAGLGFGLSKLSGTEAADVASVPPPAAASGEAETIGADGNPLEGGGGAGESASATTGPDGATVGEEPLRLRVLRATFAPARASSRGARRRARVRVRLRVEAPAGDVRLEAFRLAVAGRELKAVSGAAAPLPRTIPGGGGATGELRFELAGELADRRSPPRRAALKVGEQTVPLTFSEG